MFESSWFNLCCLVFILMLQAFREEEVTDMMDAEIEMKVCVWDLRICFSPGTKSSLPVTQCQLLGVGKLRVILNRMQCQDPKCYSHCKQWPMMHLWGCHARQGRRHLHLRTVSHSHCKQSASLGLKRPHESQPKWEHYPQRRRCCCRRWHRSILESSQIALWVLALHSV